MPEINPTAVVKYGSYPAKPEWGVRERERVRKGWRKSVGGMGECVGVGEWEMESV